MLSTRNFVFWQNVYSSHKTLEDRTEMIHEEESRKEDRHKITTLLNINS